jgi:2-methylisocitrate lyase-like PEP mutase family enzyme
VPANDNVSTQIAKAEKFRQLHERESAFLIPNPWDAGTARLLEHLGFEALATTSMGYAFSRGRPDNTLTRQETLAYAAEIVAASSLPVSADLENGFGDSPEATAEIITLAGKAGLVGGSIEDATARPEDPIYELQHAVDRVRAAVESARRLPFAFTLTARAENFLCGRPDLKDTIKRLQAYQDAGADVLYAPGLRTREEIATVVRAVDRPVNVVMGLQGVQLSVAQLSELGVRRISVGSALYRTALGAFMRAAREMLDKGTFTWASAAANPKELTPIFKPYSPTA